MANPKEGLETGSKFILPADLDQHRLHTGCEVTVHYYAGKGDLALWCNAHNQWVYVFPVAVTYHYGGNLPDRTVKVRT